MNSEQPVISSEWMDRSIQWQQYTAFIESLAEIADLPAPYSDEKTLRYTLRNYENTKRVLDYITISQKLYNRMQEIVRPQTWLVITEPWCGDVSHVLPVLFAVSGCSDLVSFKLLLRDSNSELMNMFLTNGSESIPKLIVADGSTNRVLGTWGPRPQALQLLALQYAHDASISFRDKVKFIHQWYEQDRGTSIQEELVEQVRAWNDEAGKILQQ